MDAREENQPAFVLSGCLLLPLRPCLHALPYFTISQKYCLSSFEGTLREMINQLRQVQ